MATDSLTPVLDNLLKFKRPTAPLVVEPAVEEELAIQETSVSARAWKEPRRTTRIFTAVVKNIEVKTWQEDRDAQLQRAMARWHELVMVWNDTSKAKQLMLECETVENQTNMLADIFAGRAPATISKRANSMWKFCDMLSKNGHSFPCSEAVCYNTLCLDRQAGGSIAKRKAILEAITFCRFVLGELTCEARDVMERPCPNPLLIHIKLLR